MQGKAQNFYDDGNLYLRSVFAPLELCSDAVARLRFPTTSGLAILHSLCILNEQVLFNPFGLIEASGASELKVELQRKV